MVSGSRASATVPRASGGRDCGGEAERRRKRLSSCASSVDGFGDAGLVGVVVGLLVEFGGGGGGELQGRAIVLS